MKLILRTLQKMEIGGNTLETLMNERQHQGERMGSIKGSTLAGKQPYVLQIRGRIPSPQSTERILYSHVCSQVTVTKNIARHLFFLVVQLFEPWQGICIYLNGQPTHCLHTSPARRFTSGNIALCTSSVRSGGPQGPGPWTMTMTMTTSNLLQNCPGVSDVFQESVSAGLRNL